MNAKVVVEVAPENSELKVNFRQKFVLVKSEAKEFRIAELRLYRIALNHKVV